MRTDMQTPQSRQSSRVKSLAPDERVSAIQEAVAACDAAGRRRLHIANGEYAWPRNFVALLDEMRLNAVPNEQLLLVGDAMRDAAYATVYVGTGVPTESVGEALALESVAEGDANRDAAKLVDAPKCPSRLRALFNSLTFHQTRIDHARRVVAREMVRSQ